MLCPHNPEDDHTHVTLDIDRKDGKLEIPVKLSRLTTRNPECAHIRKSASGSNIHIIACFKAGWYNIGEFFLWRMANGDDKQRISNDWDRWKDTSDIQYATGILFDVKDGLHAGPWEDLK